MTKNFLAPVSLRSKYSDLFSLLQEGFHRNSGCAYPNSCLPYLTKGFSVFQMFYIRDFFYAYLSNRYIVLIDLFFLVLDVAACS